MLTRREMLKLTAGATVGTAVPANLLAAEKPGEWFPVTRNRCSICPAKLKTGLS